MDDALFVHNVSAPGCTVISLCGELDVSTAPILTDHLADLAALGHSCLVFDLALLDFIDAYGLRVLVAAAARAQDRGGWVRLVSVRPRTRRILRILRLTRRLPIYRTVEEALSEELPRHFLNLGGSLNGGVGRFRF